MVRILSVAATSCFSRKVSYPLTHCPAIQRRVLETNLYGMLLKSIGHFCTCTYRLSKGFDVCKQWTTLREYVTFKTYWPYEQESLATSPITSAWKDFSALLKIVISLTVFSLKRLWFLPVTKGYWEIMHYFKGPASNNWVVKYTPWECTPKSKTHSWQRLLYCNRKYTGMCLGMQPCIVTNMQGLFWY